jgi:hypothetical protein
MAATSPLRVLFCNRHLHRAKPFVLQATVDVARLTPCETWSGLPDPQDGAAFGSWALTEAGAGERGSASI